MIKTFEELNALPDRMGRNLMFLRGQRDALMRSIEADCEIESAQELLEHIACYDECRGSSMGILRTHLVDLNALGSVKRLLVFDRICRRIARLEREQCWCATNNYMPAELVQA